VALPPAREFNSETGMLVNQLNRTAMKQNTLITLAAIALAGSRVPAHGQEQKPKFVHDAGCYNLDAQS